jgi:hypothetical protein
LFTGKIVETVESINFNENTSMVDLMLSLTVESK